VAVIAIIEDDNYVREQLVDFLSIQPEFPIVMGFLSMEDFLNQEYKADLLLLDIELPGMNGLEGAYHVRRRHPDTEILMLTVFEDKDRIFHALRAGASGYLVKNTPLSKIKTSILAALQGEAPMSPVIAKKVLAYFSGKLTTQTEYPEVLSAREIEVSKLLIEGMTYKQVAAQLFISPDTVRHHIKNIYRKLEINSRIELVREFKMS
jgi:DNA-binding NarL/FixJ family response regulator